MKFCRRRILIPALLTAAAMLQADPDSLERGRMALAESRLSVAELELKEALSSENPEERREALLGLAELALLRKDEAAAQGALLQLREDETLEVSPREIRLLSELDALQEKYAEGLQRLETVPPESQGLEFRYLKLRLLLAQNQEAEALLQTEGIPELALERAALLWRQGKEEEATALWTALAERNPPDEQSGWARLRLAELQLRAGQADQAARELEALQTLPLRSAELDRTWAPVLAQTLEQQGKVGEAAAVYARLLEQHAEERSLPMWKREQARLSVLSGDVTSAGALLQSLIALQGDDVELAKIQLALAQRLAADANMEAAQKAYSDYLSVFTDPVGQRQARLGLAAVLEEQGELDEAEALLEQVWHGLPEGHALAPELLSEWLSLLVKQERHEDVLKRSATLEERFPSAAQLPEALYAAALAQVELQGLESGLQSLSRLAQRFPGHPTSEKALMQRGHLLHRYTRMERALGAYNAYLDTYPEGQYRLDAMTDKGIVAYHLGLFELALSQFDAVLKMDPNSARAAQAECLRGWSLYLVGRDRDALEAGRNFLRRYPDSELVPDVRFWLAEMAFNRGEAKEAEAEFTAVASQEDLPLDRRGRAWFLAGRAALLREEQADSLVHFARAQELVPDAAYIPDLLFFQGDALTQLDRFNEAIAVFDRLISQHPDSYLVHAARGRKGDCLFTIGQEDPKRLEQALASYQQVLESPGAAAELRLQALYKTGRSLQELGKEDEARRQFERVVYRYTQDQAGLGKLASRWFVLAVTEAAQSYEREQEWREAIFLYRKLVEARLPESDEAQRRIEEIRREQLIFF